MSRLGLEGVGEGGVNNCQVDKYFWKKKKKTGYGYLIPYRHKQKQNLWNDKKKQKTENNGVYEEKYLPHR